MAFMKKLLFILVLLLVLTVAVRIWFRQCGGVTHGELKACVENESVAIQAKVDERAAALNAKLDRIEAKLDKLIDMATPKLPDGMKVVE